MTYTPKKTVEKKLGIMLPKGIVGVELGTGEPIYTLPVTTCKNCWHEFIRRKSKSKNICPRCGHCILCSKMHLQRKECSKK